MIYGYIRVSSDKQTVENQRFDVGKSQSKIKIWSLLERETDSSVTGI